MGSGTAASDDELSRREMGVAMARAQLSKVKSDLALMKAGAWRYDKLIAEAGVKQAAAQVEQTKTELSRLTVQAPRLKWDVKPEADTTEYKVLQVNIRPGECVATTGYGDLFRGANENSYYTSYFNGTSSASPMAP